ncbi:hypothetical protein ABN764_27325 [Paenibacillaceae sp. P-4]|uniref:hypothetical protein n=1 Tax=Paenibacillaceae bacterium P-4 TaxID=3160969 RepID=UPI0032E84BE7
MNGMIERLFELSLGFIWHIIKGELPLSIVGSALFLGVLFVAAGEWSERRKHARSEQFGHRVQRGMGTLFKDAFIVMVATFFVVGVEYGIFRLAARALPAWGWPVLPDGNVVLAWLSLAVTSFALVGVIILELIWAAKTVSLASFWVIYVLVYAVLSACALQWLYPVSGATPWIYLGCGLMSSLLCVLLKYLQQMEGDVDDSKEEADAISVNK